MADVARTIIKAVLERNFWIRKSKNARDLVKDCLIWDKVVFKTLKEYEQLTLERVQNMAKENGNIEDSNE